MEILVCIKQVPDDSVTVRLSEEGEPALEGITQVVNAFDTYALEMAARFKEAGEGSITVLTAGDTEASAAALRSCLSVGADHAAAVSCGAKTDTAGRARLLAKSAERLSSKPFDLIFCGSESTDLANGQLAFYLAQELGIPVVSNVLALEMNGAVLRIRQETEEGYRTVETTCPCVLSVVKPAYEPRYPSIKSKMAARRMPITALQWEEPGTDADCLPPKGKRVRISAPAVRQGGVKIEEKDTAAVARRVVALLVEQKLL